MTAVGSGQLEAGDSSAHNGRRSLGGTLGESLSAIVDGLAAATEAQLVVARVVEGERLLARAVAAASPALAAELEGSHIGLEELPAEELSAPEDLPPAVSRVAARVGAQGVLLIPASLGGTPLGSVELLRTTRAFDVHDRMVARLAASQLAVVLAASRGDGHDGVRDALHLAGEALAAAADEERTAEQVARLAVEATGAFGCMVWRLGEEAAGDAELAASHGIGAAEAEAARPAAREAAQSQETATVRPAPAGLRAGAGLVCVQLGRPPLGVLQLLFARDAEPDAPALAALAGFGAQVAQALRAGARVRALDADAEQSRTLLAVVAEAIARLSLAHTLETAIERVAELLDLERVAVYLHDGQELAVAAARGVTGPHLAVAERVLEQTQGPWRARGVLVIGDARREPSFRPVADAVRAARIEAVQALPLVVLGEPIGLLALYPPAGRSLTDNEETLLAALGGQLAVAVQNAQLHEQATQLGQELEQALFAERTAARRLRALYEISRSFAQSLSLERTLDAVARTAVELLGVDAAAIQLPDERGDVLRCEAVHVADERLREPLTRILAQPQPLGRFPIRRIFRDRRPLRLDRRRAGLLGGAQELLLPFLEKGSTAVVLPIATPNEVLATLTLLSLDPAAPIGDETVETGLSLAGQAALAVDNARLYQQQKLFADTMQRSLLPHAQPEVEGLELGHVYESSARVDVGGDVYDFMVLDDGRLAVVLGDVTGHGIDATADMAMAKFVFRSLAREHPEPADFLTHANDVVVGEIAAGKFITLLYLTVDLARGEVACASGGHPPPRLLLPDGGIGELDASGLALGIESRQTYEETRRSFEPGAAVVLFTDGVVEARRNGELYGVERLDEVLSRSAHLPAAEIARAVLDDCRRFGGEPADDCAVVVLRSRMPLRAGTGLD